MKVLSFLYSIILTIFCCPENFCRGAVKIQVENRPDLNAELPVIIQAAERNGCRGDDFIILLAIRLSENGGPGREFGVMQPAAIDTDLDTQAGWAAATIVKNRKRFEDGGYTYDFITFLGNLKVIKTGRKTFVSILRNSKGKGLLKN